MKSIIKYLMQCSAVLIVMYIHFLFSEKSFYRYFGKEVAIYIAIYYLFIFITFSFCYMEQWRTKFKVAYCIVLPYICSVISYLIMTLSICSHQGCAFFQHNILGSLVITLTFPYIASNTWLISIILLINVYLFETFRCYTKRSMQ